MWDQMQSSRSHPSPFYMDILQVIRNKLLNFSFSVCIRYLFVIHLGFSHHFQNFFRFSPLIGEVMVLIAHSGQSD